MNVEAGRHPTTILQLLYKKTMERDSMIVRNNWQRKWIGNTNKIKQKIEITSSTVGPSECGHDQSAWPHYP